MVSVSTMAMAGCSDGQEQAQSQDRVTAEDVREEAAETMEKAQAYTRQQKEDYLKKVDAQLAALDRKFVELEAKTESMQEDVRDQYEKMLVTLQQKQKETAETLEELKQASGEAWSTMKARMDALMKNLQIAFDQTEMLT
jgi:vacuolar-type H+-ATPase subunit I/STV1